MPTATALRTHTCGELRVSDAGSDVVLAGWLHNRRDLGGVLFIDLRDHYGVTQVVVHPETKLDLDLAHMQKETVLRVEGGVVARSPEPVHPRRAHRRGGGGGACRERAGSGRAAAAERLPGGRPARGHPAA